MAKKFFAALFMFLAAFCLSLGASPQEGTAKEEAKQTLAQEKAEKQKSVKEAPWEGMVVRSDKDEKTVTVRRRGSTTEKVIYYNSATRFTSQEHGSKKVNTVDPSQVKDDDRVICLGHYDDKGEFHASLISKRLTQ